MCKSHRMNVFIGVIYAYKGLLLVSDGDDAGDNDEDGESRNMIYSISCSLFPAIPGGKVGSDGALPCPPP